jgi:hypothetical protein
VRIAVSALTATAAALATLAPPAHADTARDVRTAVVAAAAYAEDHGGSYAGMTLAGLRRWVNVKNVKVVRATRRSYCLQSITGRRVHFDGPGGPLRYGACGTRGALVPAAKPPPAPKPQADWEKTLRNGGIIAVAYYSEHNSYTGMTLVAMKVYDPTLAGVSVAWAKGDGFCIQTADAAHHLSGSDFKPTAGKCPPPSS